MNWANRLTLSRLALTILFVAALSSPWRYAHTTALITFLVAGITDFFDGEIARRYQTVTDFGKLMDPLVDKIMIAAAVCRLPLRALRGSGRRLFSGKQAAAASPRVRRPWTGRPRREVDRPRLR